MVGFLARSPPGVWLAMVKQKKLYKSENRREWQPREQRLVAEYLAKFYPKYEVRTRVHIGYVQPRLMGKFVSEATERLVGVFRNWVDAVIIMPDKLVMIEAKILPRPGVVGQILFYEGQLPFTPEFAEHKHKPIESVLLCAIEDPRLTKFAREHGIRVVVYRPKWIDAYLKIVYARERTPSQGAP